MKGHRYKTTELPGDTRAWRWKQTLEHMLAPHGCGMWRLLGELEAQCPVRYNFMVTMMSENPVCGSGLATAGVLSGVLCSLL